MIVDHSGRLFIKKCHRDARIDFPKSHLEMEEISGPSFEEKRVENGTVSVEVSQTSVAVRAVSTLPAGLAVTLLATVQAHVVVSRIGITNFTAFEVFAPLATSTALLT